MRPEFDLTNGNCRIGVGHTQICGTSGGWRLSAANLHLSCVGKLCRILRHYLSFFRTCGIKSKLGIHVPSPAYPMPATNGHELLGRVGRKGTHGKEQKMFGRRMVTDPADDDGGRRGGYTPERGNILYSRWRLNIGRKVVDWSGAGPKAGPDSVHF